MSTKHTHQQATYIWRVWRAVMLVSTLIIAFVLLMAGSIMGAGGTGLFGAEVSATQQLVGQILVISAVALAGLAGFMLRRKVKPFLIAALLIVGVDLVAFLFVENGSAPMFALTYGVVMAVAFTKSR